MDMWCRLFYKNTYPNYVIGWFWPMDHISCGVFWLFLVELSAIFWDILKELGYELGFSHQASVVHAPLYPDMFIGQLKWLHVSWIWQAFVSGAQYIFFGAFPLRLIQILNTVKKKLTVKWLGNVWSLIFVVNAIQIQYRLCLLWNLMHQTLQIFLVWDRYTYISFSILGEIVWPKMVFQGKINLMQKFTLCKLYFGNFDKMCMK